MTQKSWAERVVAVLSSLRLAVVTMIVLGGVCAWATFYEADHGTAAVQRVVYQTPWFSGLLALLGVNIAAVMASRWPWKAHHAGFLVAHLGILLILAGSWVSLHRGLDSNMALFEGQTTDRVALLEKAIHATVGSAHGSFPAVFERRPPRPDREQRWTLPGSDVSIVAEDYAQHAEAHEQIVGASSGGPALRFLIEAPNGRETGWLLADDPERSHLHLGPLALSLRVGPDSPPPTHEDGSGQLEFLWDRARASLSLAHHFTAGGEPATVAVETGRPLALRGFQVTVEQLLPQARVVREVVRAESLPAEDRRTPAVRLRLESPAGRSESEWLFYGESRTLRFGQERAMLAFQAPELAVPFRVTLLRFNSEKYPGSNMPATYESWVRVDDPERGSSEHHISMNHPLHYRGYIFFQSSFVEGTPMMSIFSVARAPGLPFVYLGTALIGIGVAWMFYLKPHLARRRAAAAVRRAKGAASPAPGESDKETVS